ncbi:hypothetical protein SAMN05421819_3568 [Bryocella elongata]|uniref:Uncharacterized protein n=1 Tax=Bryocella elongata TaxID=863522 RepID=A0A1H6B712_9BACT|nr:hypothetical protein SAMN05421819_3568 [Bryocella elongata]
MGSGLGWVYPTLARNTGWTYGHISEMPACDVIAFLEHLAEHPPDYVILGAVHLKQADRKTGSGVSELSQFVGGARAPTPGVLAEIAWAREWEQRAGLAS